jgi:hypothetical protein
MRSPLQVLRDHGLLTVHFAAVPPGTPDLLLKFVPPETLAEIGGAEAKAPRSRSKPTTDAILHLLADGPEDVAELRAVLLQEHGRRPPAATKGAREPSPGRISDRHSIVLNTGAPHRVLDLCRAVLFTA